jgi:hypothetical protein
MKKILLLVLLINLLNYSQTLKKENIVGIWQANTNIIGSGYQETYQFFINGNFIFHTNQNDGLQRILEIKGSYILVADTIYLKVKSTIEKIGGKICRSEITTLSDSWEIIDCQLKEINQSSYEVQNIIYEPCKDKSENCLILDKSNAYYRINKDPNKY